MPSGISHFVRRPHAAQLIVRLAALAICLVATGYANAAPTREMVRGVRLVPLLPTSLVDIEQEASEAVVPATHVCKSRCGTNAIREPYRG